MNIQFYQKLTLLDYPSKTACTVFTHGCNLRCPFCHNASLVVRPPEECVDEAEFFAFLEKRKRVLDGICITGGEPLLQPDIADFIKKVRDIGYLVKLDTNGFFPDRLKSLIDTGLVDYVAMDIKNSKEKYALTCGLENADLEKVCRSVEILKTSGIDFEFRTTAVSGFHEPADFESIGRWLCGDYKYYIQCFKDSGDTIEKSLDALPESVLNDCLSQVLPFLPKAQLRGL